MTTKMYPALLDVLLSMRVDNAATLEGGWRTLPVRRMSHFATRAGDELVALGLIERRPEAAGDTRLYRVTDAGEKYVDDMCSSKFHVNTHVVKFDLDTTELDAKLDALSARLSPPRAENVWIHVKTKGEYEVCPDVVRAFAPDGRFISDCVRMHVFMSSLSAYLADSPCPSGAYEEAIMQTSTPIRDAAWFVAYRSRTSDQLYLRPVAEFYDGRFARIRS